ncbi:MAG: conjugal transfer protein TraB [Deltaproteobacteria bacterium]|nr:conjugal transfer protein TraB [Deltaproteobacteria bacterium]
MELPANTTVLEDGERTFYIVGTAHVSEASANEVREVIEAVQPDTVCLELCQTRYDALTDEDRWKKLDVFRVIRDGKTLMLLANLAIGAYQRRMGAQLGVQPGAELLAGAESAEAIGARIELVDREIQTTLRRTWANVSFWRKAELISAIMASTLTQETLDEETIEELKEQANLSKMLEEFSEALPEVKGPLIDERDAYLMSGIEDAPGEKVVAVVGAAHVPGMKRLFGTPVDRERLDEQPERAQWTKALKWVIPALVMAAFLVGYFKHQDETLEQMLYAWVIPNSVLAALMTTIALAKPLSVLVAFIASPITSLNPLLGAGMVVGLLEAWLRKPTVEDAERINEDVQSLGGFYRNPFTRVLLVAFMATLGSALGAWVGAGWVVTLLT